MKNNAGINGGLAEWQRRRRAGEIEAPKYRKPSERAAENPTSLRLAIALHCHNCMGGERAPGVRDDIRGCSATSCALFTHRPYRYPHERKAGEESPEAFEESISGVEESPSVGVN